jgi:hypothetical protein
MSLREQRAAVERGLQQRDCEQQHENGSREAMKHR